MSFSEAQEAILSALMVAAVQQNNEALTKTWNDQMERMLGASIKANSEQLAQTLKQYVDEKIQGCSARSVASVVASPSPSASSPEVEALRNQLESLSTVVHASLADSDDRSSKRGRWASSSSATRSPSAPPRPLLPCLWWLVASHVSSRSLLS